jgi:glycosyltransferase involved in cell wall biosynthesis
MGIPTSRIREVPHGVLRHSESALGGTAESESSQDGICRMLLFGSIKQYKGLDVLLHALSLVPQSVRAKCRLKVAGKPDLPERDLHQLAVDYGVEQCVDWQLRFFVDDEVDGLFQQCDVVVFPYRRIDASGALMTALPYRKAIIASQLGQFAELLENDKSALLVPPGDPQALARALERIVSSHMLRAQLAEGMDDVVRSIPSWDDIGKRTVDFYVECRAQRWGVPRASD